MLKRIIDKRLKLHLCQYSARRIVWKTQIYKCRIRLRQFRNKTIIEGAWHHFDILPSARYIGSGAPRHYICVDIHWIYRVGHCHRIAYIEYISNIASIAFRSICSSSTHSWCPAAASSAALSLGRVPPCTSRSRTVLREKPIFNSLSSGRPDARADGPRHSFPDRRRTSARSCRRCSRASCCPRRAA